jgi:hypothetical protein
MAVSYNDASANCGEKVVTREKLGSVDEAVRFPDMDYYTALR